MKRTHFTILLAALAITATALSACQKDDLLTALSSEAKPEQTRKIGDHDSRGAWAGKKKISAPVPPVPPQ